MTLFISNYCNPEEGLKELFKFDKLIWDARSGLSSTKLALPLKVELTKVVDSECVFPSRTLL